MRRGRFDTSLEKDAATLNASVGFDWRLLPHDVEGSKAHARMLATRGILTAADAEAICAGLDEVRGEWERGELKLDAAREDVHMNVEARLTEKIGDAGARLHTGRSRNDQVATDLRLYARAAAERLTAALRALGLALVGQAERHLDTFAPGYTHLQRAQPIRLAHHFLAYVEMLLRDVARLGDAARRASVSPLGSGALAGTTLPIDREHTARALGFAAVSANSLDAVSDRDFAVELVAACALAMSHLSRMGEELVLWASQEHGFVRLPEEYCSGSSLMPQKMNPDIPELIRAKSGRVVGDLVTLLMVLKGLPLAYNKDLQETQEPLYDAVETTELAARTMAGLVARAEFQPARLRAALDAGNLLATEVADHLVTRGVPFRVAHGASGAIVRRAVERGVDMATLGVDEMRAAVAALPELAAAAAAIDDDLLRALDVERAIERRDLPGAPARARVLAAIAEAKRQLT